MVTSAERQYQGTRLRKLGVRAGMRVLLVDIHDTAFAAELVEAGAEVLGGTGDAPDMVFVGVHSIEDLGRVARYRDRISKQGTLWLVRPKGPDTPVPEAAAMAAGLEAGLVDVKVVSFSESHSALKYVYRLRDR
ncbi:MAG: hypothetical protein NVSMB17_18830 [Candidatus Dormibacteria bacterium]